MSNKQIIIVGNGIFRYWHLVLFMLGGLILVFRYYIVTDSKKIEYGYSRFLYPYIADTIAWISRIVPAPYSASELFSGAVISGVLILFCRDIWQTFRQKRSIIKFIIKTAIYGIAVLSGIYFFFLTAWGFNYLRQPFFLYLNPENYLKETALESSDYEQFAYYIVTLANSLHPVMMNMEEIDTFTDRALKKVIAEISSYDIPDPPPTKHFIFNNLMNIFGISGIFVPFFMEQHINSELLAWEKPYVIAHEKAHFIGFASETDANLIASISCLNSESEHLRYSAALNILIKLSDYIPAKKWKTIINNDISPDVRQDIENRYARIEKNYKSYSRLWKLSRKTNDTYLKLNSQKLGIDSYQAALPHLVIWWKKGTMNASNNNQSDKSNQVNQASDNNQRNMDNQ